MQDLILSKKPARSDNEELGIRMTSSQLKLLLLLTAGAEVAEAVREKGDGEGDDE